MWRLVVWLSLTWQIPAPLAAGNAPLRPLLREPRLSLRSSDRCTTLLETDLACRADFTPLFYDLVRALLLSLDF